LSRPGLNATIALLATEATYEGVVKAADAVGNDTETTVAVAGGLAGVRDGASSIPTRWQHTHSAAATSSSHC